MKYLEEYGAIEMRQIERFADAEKKFSKLDFQMKELKSSLLSTDQFLEHYIPFKQ